MQNTESPVPGGARFENNWRLTKTHPKDHGLPVLATVDVVVIGAGAAGVAAATTLAEAGKSVILVEKYGFAGGAAVAGMSGTICGLYLASESNPNPVQLIYGFTERFRAALEARGGLTSIQPYGKTWTVAHDPLMWRETADEFLTGSGVRTLFHTSLSGVIIDQDAHIGVVVNSNAGESAIHALRTIDASGDAAAVVRAGGAYRFGDGGRIQNPTMFFRLGGVDTTSFWEHYGEDTICPPSVSEQIVAARATGLDLPREKIWIFKTTRPGELLVNATRLAAHDGRMLNVIDPEDFTEAEILGRQQVRSYAEFMRTYLPGCERGYVVDTGVEVGIRQTRSIEGAERLTNAAVISCEKRPDGIARVPWPIELHEGDKPSLHWLLDDYYEVPYLALVPVKHENIIVAGRCLSADHEALASARVTAQCFEYGKASATATLMSLTDDIPYRHIDGADVRLRMIESGSAL